MKVLACLARTVRTSSAAHGGSDSTKARTGAAAGFEVVGSAMSAPVARTVALPRRGLLDGGGEARVGGVAQPLAGGRFDHFRHAAEQALHFLDRPRIGLGLLQDVVDLEREGAGVG